MAASSFLKIESPLERPAVSKRLTKALEGMGWPLRTIEAVDAVMRHLIDRGLADLPLPGQGRTLERWRALSEVAACDLSLAKIYEGHTDALAILAELGGLMKDGLWAVWAAEPPNARVVFQRREKTGGVVSGLKAWCSGAAVVDHAVMSAWTERGQPILVQVDLRQPGAVVDSGRWQAVGMGASQSVSVHFENVPAEAIGDEGQYIDRPGFWQGGAGIAAVWYGGAVAIARTLASGPRAGQDPHAAAHLGACDVALRSVRALLNESAAWIDAHPAGDAFEIAFRTRAAVESAAHLVLERTGRASGPGPLCEDAAHAQRCADLPVFLRQSHAERDLAALGRRLIDGSPTWNL